MTTRKLLEDIRSLYEAAEAALNDKEQKQVLQTVSRAIGKKADYMMGDSYYHTGAIDFGGLGKYDLYVGKKSQGARSYQGSDKDHYVITIEDVEEGTAIANDSAKTFKDMLKVVTKLAKKHKKGMTSS
jgi:hypothetical protein